MKINPRMPTPPKNGALTIQDDLVKTPHRRHVLMAIVDCDRIETDTETDSQTPRVRFLRVEVIPELDYNEAERLLRRAWAGRQYEPTLPYEGQADIWADVFNNIDGTKEDPKDWEARQAEEGAVDAEIISESTELAVPDGELPNEFYDSDAPGVTVSDDDETDNPGDPFRPPFSS